MLYTEIAINLHVKRWHVVKLHQQMIKIWGYIIVFGQGEGSKRGPKEEVHRQLNRVQVQSIVSRVDEYHGDGRKITNREIRKYLRLEHGVTTTKPTISSYFKWLGLT
jgi:hypothetical protein